MKIEQLQNKTFSRNPEIIASWIDNEIVTMSINTGKYYTLNYTAAAIWEALNDTQGFNEIVQSLTQKFDVSEDVCREQVAVCISTIVDKKLILESA